MLAAIGGVSLKRWYYGPELLWHARQALLQARGDPLCLQADVFTHRGLYFSLSVWHDAEAMLTFLVVVVVVSSSSSSSTKEEQTATALVGLTMCLCS